MNPALMDYLMQVQNQQDEQGQMTEQGIPEQQNPFSSGIQMAMQSARQSMGIPSPREAQRQAFGRGMISFGQSMGQPYENKFAAINQALGSGINSYMAEKDKHDQMNMALYDYALQQKQYEEERNRRLQDAAFNNQYRMQKQEEQALHHQESLAEQRRHHDLMNQYRMDSLADRRERAQEKNSAEIAQEGIKGLNGVEYAPLQSLTRPELTRYANDSAKEIANLPINKKGKHVLSEMKTIIKEYPDIGTSFLNLLTGEKSWGDLIMRNNPLVNKKKLNAIEKLEKLSSELRLDIIGNLPGSKGTDLVKRLIDKAAASGKTLEESTKYVIDQTDRTFDNNINRIKIIEDAKKKRMYPLFSTMEEEDEEGVQPTVHENTPSEMHSDISALSDEELMRIAGS